MRKKTFLIVVTTFAVVLLWSVPNAAYAASAPTNLILNPSVETVSATDATMPTSWEQDNWGTNAATFAYIKNAGQQGTHSLSVSMTSYSSGDATWFFDDVAVTPSTSYTYSDYYESNTYTEALAEYITASGQRSFSYLGLISPSTTWQNWMVNLKTPANTAYMTVLHILDSVGTLQTDSYSLSLTQAAAVQVSITAPTANATVSCAAPLTASVTGTATIKNVQFQVDGVSVGKKITKAPYTLSWDSSSVADGQHSVSAIATDSNGQQYTAVPVNVIVANSTFTPAGNMIANGSVEQAACSGTTTPMNWSNFSYGTNNAKFTYAKTGHTGTRSLKIAITSWTDGGAEWIMDPVSVQPNSLYTYSEWYETNASDEEIIVAEYASDGTVSYEYLANPTLSTTWANYSVTITTYSNTVAISILHTLDSTGTISSDDYSLMPYTPVGFNRAIVSVTLDDGWVSAYDNALPILDQYGFKATWYIIPDLTNTTGAMTTAQVNAIKNDGQELASHTMDHVDLTQLDAADLQFQLQQSQIVMQADYGVPIDGFASPFGLYNSTTIAAIEQYYNYNRTVDVGYNSKDNFNKYYIKVQNVTVDTTDAQVQEWVNQAVATKTWLVLVYHDVGAATQYTFNTSTADFAANMQAIANSGVTVLPMEQALAEIEPQV